ncbi:hypothetical protein FKP11_06295 [Salmonella enterica]|nr:hypothetical protein [Salmonella enterica]
MIVVELIIVLLAIFLGARLGGIGIGFAGGLGVLVLAAIGVKPGTIPFDVISIIMAVIAAISAMQVAGGLDYLVNQTEKLLRKNPKYITILAPIVTYFLTIFAGTGNISLATLPVIAEVAKEQGIKPCRPLSTAVVSAQIAITASPISAAVVYMSSVMEGHGISYIHLLSVVIPSPLTAVASFAAVSGLFILPTYPTLVAAVQMDDTGTTRIGKFVFNHPFFIPGTLGVVLAVCFGFLLGSFML